MSAFTESVVEDVALARLESLHYTIKQAAGDFAGLMNAAIEWNSLKRN
jgi:hypothetical protein